MAKSTRSPLEQFFARMRDLARARDVLEGRPTDDRLTVGFLMGLWAAQDGKCFWTGMDMGTIRGLVDGAVKPELCTPDRIRNDIGYTIENINLVRHDVNMFRKDMPFEQFGRMCGMVHGRAVAHQAKYVASGNQYGFHN